MGTSRLIILVLVGWISLASVVSAEDLLFPYMHGLNYSEYDQAMKLGLTAHVCKDEAEWYAMKTADFAQYKAIIIPDCQCNTSLDTIRFLDDTKSVWSPAVTGNMVIIGTDPSFHHKWFKLAGADAMMNDSIKLVSTGENGTGMYMSLSCYYQSVAAPVSISALSEIGDFRVRGNLSHPCLNNAHLVAKSDVMTSLTDELASNWNCSVHEAFSEFPSNTSRGFQALAIALNATGPGQRSFGDGTSGIPYIIARGATPVGCGNNKTEPQYNEECDDGPANGKSGVLCSSSCQCLFGMVTPGMCRSNTTSSSTSSAQSSTLYTNSSSISTSTSMPLATNSSSSHGPATVTATGWPSNSTTWSMSNTDPVTVTVFPPGASRPWYSDTTSSTLSNSNDTVLPIPPPRTVTVEPPMHSEPGTVTVLPPSRSGPVPGSVPGTVTVQPPSVTISPPRTVTVLPPTPSESASVPPTVTVQPPKPSASMPLSVSKSSTSRGDVTVTASGEPDSLSPRRSTSTTTSKSLSSTFAGNITVTGSVNKGTPTPKSFASESAPVSKPFTSPGPGIITVTASGQPRTPPPKESTPTPEKSSSTRPSNSAKAGTETGSPKPTATTATTVPVPSFPGNHRSTATKPTGQTGASGRPQSSVSRLTVTAKRSDESSQPPNSQTKSPQEPSASHKSGTSREPIDSTRLTPPIVTVTAHPSGQSPSSLSSTHSDYSSESATVSGSQSPQPVTTVIAPETQSGSSSFSSSSSSIHTWKTLPSGKGSKSWSSSSRTGFTSAFSTNLPIGASTATPSDSNSHPPTTKPWPDQTSRVKASTSTGPPGTSTARDGSDSHTIPSSQRATSSGISSAQSADINDPFKTSSSETSRTGLPSDISSSAVRTNPSTSSRPFSVPAFNSSTISTSPITATSSDGRNGNPSAPSSTLVASPNHCDKWVGIEIIHMIEITEICPEGSTVTETVTEIVETMTRSICQTSATNLPCYPCIFGTPTSGQDTATVTVTSCSTSTEPTVTITVQLCKTCTTTTYTGTVPGYTPGAPCHACSPYDPGSGSATAAIPPPVAVSTTPLGYNPIPHAGTSSGERKTTTPNGPLPTSVPDKSSPSETVSSPGGNPGGGAGSGVGTSPVQAIPTLLSKTLGHDIGYGFPTSPVTPYPPAVVTAGGGRNVARYSKGVEVVLGLYFVYALVVVWL